MKVFIVTQNGYEHTVIVAVYDTWEKAIYRVISAIARVSFTMTIKGIKTGKMTFGYPKPGDEFNVPVDFYDDDFYRIEEHIINED